MTARVQGIDRLPFTVSSSSSPSGMPQRFRKSQQLTHDREYQRVYAGRTSVTKGPLRVSAAVNEHGRTRIGLSVPGRVGTNVKRNRIKRLIREAFRLNQGAMPAGLDLVIGVHPHDERTVAEYAALLLSAAEMLAPLAKKKSTTETQRHREERR